MMKNKKAMPVGRQGFAPILILVVFAGIVLFLVYKNFGIKNLNLVVPYASPTVVPVDTKDWKTYADSSYKIALMYPNNWRISDCLGDTKECDGANNIVELRPPLIVPGSSDVDSFSVEVFGDSYCASISNSARNVWKWENFKELIYENSGYKGTLFEGYTKYPNEKTYFRKLAILQQDKNCFVVNYANSNKFAAQNIFDQILSTFKFTN